MDLSQASDWLQPRPESKGTELNTVMQRCAVRVRPERLRPSDSDNPFVTAHRLLARAVMEDWLSGLRLAHPGRRNRLADRLG